MKLWVSAVAMILLCASPVLAQTVWRVPVDYTTIQEAVSAASPGDTVRIGPGTYCGASVTKQLTILGEGQPIIQGCSGISIGLSLSGYASGTVIQHLNFSGLGTGVQAVTVSDLTIAYNNFSDVGFGIWGIAGVSNVTVAHNTIESYNFGVFSFLLTGSSCRQAPNPLESAAREALMLVFLYT